MTFPSNTPDFSRFDPGPRVQIPVPGVPVAISGGRDLSAGGGAVAQPHDPYAVITAEDLVEIDVVELRTEFDLPELADSAEEADALVVANAHLAALGHVEREIAANDAEHERLIAYYRERHEERQAKLAARADYLRGVLRTVLTAYPPSKGKSRKLLAGTIGTRARPARVQIVDPDACLAWAKAEHPDAVETTIKERVPAKAVQEYPDAPGVQVVPASEDFYAAPGR